MKIGTIFIWRDYPHLLMEDEKDIWCVYLGETEAFYEPVFVLFHKLTGRDYYYKVGGERENRRHYKFTTEEYQKLKKDSIFDFEQYNEAVHKSEFEKIKIEIIQELPNDKVRMIYNNIKEPYCRYEYEIKCRIFECLNNEGIYGLEKPKRKNIRRPY